MLKPYKMTKLLIAGPSTYLEPVISELHKQKVLHIIEHIKQEDIDIGAPLSNSSYLSELLVKIRSISSHLNLDKNQEIMPVNIKNGYADLEKVSNELSEEVNKNLEELKDFESKIEKNKTTLHALSQLAPLNVPLDAFKDFKSITTFTGFINNLEDFENKLRQQTDSYQLLKEDKKDPIVLTVKTEEKEQALELLRKSDFIEFDISSIKGLEGNIYSNMNRLEKENENLIIQSKDIDKKNEILKHKWQSYLLFAEEFLSKEMEKAEAPLKMASTKNTFIVRGWIPTNNLINLTKELNYVSKGKIFIETEKVDKKDSIPVKLNHPKYVKPFEFFLNLYTMPKYKEIDPTFFVFLIFPLMFGFILGDIGYGIVTVIFALIMRAKMPKAKAFLNVFLYSGAATIFFGMLFGEIFGLEVIFGRHLPHILSRAHDASILLSISLAVGIFHLLLGLIIGFINIKVDHGWKHAIYEKLGWIMLFPGIIKIILLLNILTEGFQKIFEFIAPHNYLTITLALVGIYLIIKGEGVKGIVELPAIFSNLLSYARLMAVGVASVILAVVVNELAGEMFHSGIGGIIGGIVIIIVGHTINILLGWLGGFLQSLRLHYVEFFSKFFQGGAQPYKPFGLRTEDY